MNAERQRIKHYAQLCEQYLVGPAEDRAIATAELLDHLSDAAEAEELEQTLERFGPPEAAAALFSRDRARPLAAMGDRLVAAAIDNLPLIVVTVALLVEALVRGSPVTVTFPPFVYVAFTGGCAALVPVCDVYPSGWLQALGIPVALAWSILALGLMESRWGATPGKLLLHMRVVTEEGIRISVHSGLVRRLSFLVGPLAWLDWVPVLWGDRQRVLDKVSATKVVFVGRTPKREGPARAE